MSRPHIDRIAAEMTLDIRQVEAVVALLNEGATVPFISRYRKEATGSLDEVAVTAVRDRLHQLEELDARKEAVLKSMEQHGHLTPELEASVREAETLAEVEDIYLPFRPKRRTRATIAREKGLEPLANRIFAQEGIDPEAAAREFIDEEKGVASVEDALSGARDIIAERINEDGPARARLRDLFLSEGIVKSRVATGRETDGAKFKDYFEWEESVKTVPSHRLLAMRRGENEDILNLIIAPDEESAIAILEAMFVRGDGPDAGEVRLAVQDSYKRLLSRSMETETRLVTKQRADAEAIAVFAENLRQLLLAAPLGAKRVLGLDPGFRTGCKLICLDRQGKLLHHDTIYPHTGQAKAEAAADTVRALCERFQIEAIAIGNGTAGRETEAFVRGLGLPAGVSVILVNESGASIYSASETAREEFPDLDLTVRGAVSIGRRLMDPLAELVKIDPKSIGVGQYQHDVDQSLLRQALDDVVVSCVNGVGVDVNRASVQLLTYVSGIGPTIAKNILTFRNENGPFRSRAALKDVPRLGPKAFEQSAGFLRIADGEHPLDASAVHPERYPLVDRMAADLDCTIADLLKSEDLRKRIDIAAYVTDDVGLPTLKDILKELAKPGRDPRDAFEAFSFAEGVTEIDDLEPGMRLPGIVTNITRFGAFVDIGVHQDGLVHISQLADRFVNDPADVVRVHQTVEVTVLEIDRNRRRIGLSMKSNPMVPNAATATDPPAAQPKKGSRRVKPQGKKATDAKSGPAPFNNPFADFFNSGRRG